LGMTRLSLVLLAVGRRAVWKWGDERWHRDGL